MCVNFASHGGFKTGSPSCRLTKMTVSSGCGVDIVATGTSTDFVQALTRLGIELHIALPPAAPTGGAATFS